ncbi:hypothetical protein CH370_09335 [Leptospira kmetyi]|nr:hypothetical protein CH370_09335 [Leptospira kmetyi]
MRGRSRSGKKPFRKRFFLKKNSHPMSNFANSDPHLSVIRKTIRIRRRNQMKNQKSFTQRTGRI